AAVLELRGDPEAPREAVDDVDLEADHAAAVGGILERVGLAALDVAAPAQLTAPADLVEGVGRLRRRSGVTQRDEHDDHGARGHHGSCGSCSTPVRTR